MSCGVEDPDLLEKGQLALRRTLVVPKHRWSLDNPFGILPTQDCGIGNIWAVITNNDKAVGFGVLEDAVVVVSLVSMCGIPKGAVVLNLHLGGFPPVLRVERVEAKKHLITTVDFQPGHLDKVPVTWPPVPEQLVCLTSIRVELYLTKKG